MKWQGLSRASVRQTCAKGTPSFWGTSATNTGASESRDPSNHISTFLQTQCAEPARPKLHVRRRQHVSLNTIKPVSSFSQDAETPMTTCPGNRRRSVGPVGGVRTDVPRDRSRRTRHAPSPIPRGPATHCFTWKLAPSTCSAFKNICQCYINCRENDKL